MLRYLNVNFAKGFAASTLALWMVRTPYSFHVPLGANMELLNKSILFSFDAPYGRGTIQSPFDPLPVATPWSVTAQENVVPVTNYPWWLLASVGGFGYSYYKG